MTGLKGVDVPRRDADQGNFEQIRQAARQSSELLAEFDVHALVLPENQTEVRVSLSSDQNNYAPAGWSSARYVLLNVTATTIITGLSATVTQRRKTLIHVGTEEVTLGFYEESGLSTAANRIALPTPNDVYMLKNWAQEIWYDTTAARWRFI